MNSKIALITDIHSNLEALKAILLDVKRQNIKTIYSLGDLIGLGPHPKECLDLLLNNNIIPILGNAEYYITLGVENFEYLKKHNTERYDNAIWTKEQLTLEQINSLSSMANSIELQICGKSVALCHFPIDVRYDFLGIRKYNGINVRPFFETNTSKDIRFIEPTSKLKTVANQDPLFNGKKINDFDIIIFGHYHFYREHKVNGVEFYSLNGSGVGIDKQAIYYTLEVENDEIIVKENKVDYDYEKVYSELEHLDYPNKETFKRYIKKI